MKRITENYNDFTKEELLAECHARNIEGVNASSLKADIVAALELNDEQKSESGAEEDLKTTPPLPAPVKSNIPQVTPIPEVENDGYSRSLKDEDFTGGTFKMRERIATTNSEGVQKWQGTLYPGEVMALCVHEPNTYGRTHTLKNNLHQWEGSEMQFQVLFEKA